MRTIDVCEVTTLIRDMCIESNIFLPDDIKSSLIISLQEEPWENAQDILKKITDNFTIAEEKNMPVCQDTGVACVFLEIGQDVHFVGGSLVKAVDEGVRQGYHDGYLRKSLVRDPLRRINTGDNTPAMLYTEIVDGESVKVTVAPKGFGSENMSQIKMLRPSDGVEGVIDFVLQVVSQAGSNPCPPIVVGVGIGGTFDKAATLSKRALMRDITGHNLDPYYAKLEQELLTKINQLGIGPQGLGGKTTALAVSIEQMPTHIAGLPVAVGINCHVTRHVTREV